MAIELVPLCNIHVRLAPPIIVGEAPGGTRVIGEVLGFEATGERLQARMHGNASADWLRISPDGTLGTLDVRVTMQTHDGAIIFAQYTGRMDFTVFPPTIIAAPQFETGDARYAWLTRIQAVSKGVMSPDMSELTYEIYEAR